MKLSWYQIYIEEIAKKADILDYVNDKVKYKKIFINLIKKYSPTKKIIEAGCGTGVISTYMAANGYLVTAVDIDDKILKLAEKISNEYDSLIKPKFIKMSILDLNYKEDEFDVSFSNGVLEHFNDQKAITILEAQMKISKTVIIGVPTRYFSKEEAMYGDERYLKFKHWRKVIRKAGGKIIEEKSYHFTGLKDQLLKLNKYFRPKPFKIFVIKKK